jgi:hypothetical protein
MYVTYKTFINKRIINNYSNGHCFKDTFDKNWNYMYLKIKTTPLTKDLKDFWLDLVKEIEPSIKIINDKTLGECVKIPYLKSEGKTLFMLSIIRYLWEGSNYYDEIVPMTKVFLDKYPNVDKLTAVVICASNTTGVTGWGHSIVLAVASKLPKIWHYRRFNNTSCQFLCNPEGSYLGADRHNELRNIRKLKKDNFDFEPILKHYNLNYN